MNEKDLAVFTLESGNAVIKALFEVWMNSTTENGARFHYKVIDAKEFIKKLGSNEGSGDYPQQFLLYIHQCIVKALKSCKNVARLRYHTGAIIQREEIGAPVDGKLLLAEIRAMFTGMVCYTFFKMLIAEKSNLINK